MDLHEFNMSTNHKKRKEDMGMSETHTPRAGYLKQVAKDRYYLSIAEAVARKSTCNRRNYGAVIVKNDEIISTGYNGSPRDCVNCSEMGVCMRDVANAPKGKGYNLCLSVHAEMNAIVSAARRDMIGSTLYIVGLERDGSYANPSPCLVCHRLIVNAGVSRVVGLQKVDGADPKAADVVTIDVTSASFQNRIYDEEYLPLFNGDESAVPNEIKVLKNASKMGEIRNAFNTSMLPESVRQSNSKIESYMTKGVSE